MRIAMAELYRLLFVQVEDALLIPILDQLRLDGVAAEFEKVTTPEAALGLVRATNWDAILFALSEDPSVAPLFLDSLQKLGYEQPLILLYDQEQERETLTLLKTGARDCVLKSDLCWLALVLNREVQTLALRRQLRQAQKLEAIGVLAGGIAHDFNNVLAAILGYAELVKDELPPESMASANLEQILKAGGRAKDLVQQILSIGRRVEGERTLIQLQPIIHEALKLLRASLPRTIQLQTDIDSDCGPVQGEPSQLHQVLMNLCTNAYQAMKETGGLLRIRLRETVVTEEVSCLNSDLRQGQYLQLTVADTGPGMDSATLARIFDPGFSTRESGEGTGLGLAVVQSIIKGHGGGIGVQSEPGRGAAFHIYLPCRSKLVAETQATLESAVRGQGHILFVDDEEQIVHSHRQLLERLGYEVTGMSNSLAALAAFRARPEQYQVVVTDLTMPRLTGIELVRQLRQIRPDIPVILCTGFSEKATPEVLQTLEINGFLTKPVTSREMALLLSKVLGEKSSGNRV
jgi:signal transduction histidine kinase/ActR/RegA family two-component response regulator